MQTDPVRDSAPVGRLTSSLTGVMDGIQNALWCAAFAAVIFSGAMATWLPAGLVLLLAGCGLSGLVMVAVGQARPHLMGTGRLAVVVLGLLSISMTGALGAGVSGSAGLSTMVALMAISSLLIALSFLIAARSGISRLLELVPHPVICGFMAGVCWLFVNAAVLVTTGEPISPQLPELLANGENTTLLIVSLSIATLIILLHQRLKGAWFVPVSLLLASVVILWLSHQFDNHALMGPAVIANGESIGTSALLEGLAWSSINWNFIYASAPELLIIVFFALLAAPLSLSRLSSSLHQDIDNSKELQSLGLANLLCAMALSSPCITQTGRSSRLGEAGSASRMAAIVSALVCLALIPLAGYLLIHMPWAVIGAILFIVTFRLVDDWLFVYVRGFQPADYVIAGLILLTIIVVGLKAGVLVGVLLTVFLYVLRFSMIGAVQGQFSLRDYRSSVERPTQANLALDEHGNRAIFYTLRGYLFFGTANSIEDRIKQDVGNSPQQYLAIVLDFKRVTGVDLSALASFVQIRKFCEAQGVHLLYSGVPLRVEMRMLAMKAVDSNSEAPLFFDELDYASEYIEDLVLDKYSNQNDAVSIRALLSEILENESRVRLLMHALLRIECREGEVLFEQGEQDNGFYIMESGSLSAFVQIHGGIRHRVKKFGAGSLIGEMSMFMPEKSRTATIIADKDSVLYYMSSLVLNDLDLQESRLAGAIYELMARTLGSRVNYMNQRLMLELE